ncbi:hypothetical protein [Pseudolysinimonas sp.]|uniref:hypothetical protein n=1 Tax=Pseudolysinimonas sp. TaxID=2680009 RepID=UPI003F7E9E8C
MSGTDELRTESPARSTTGSTTGPTAEFYAGLAREILQHYPRGPVAVAVTGPEAATTRAVANAFAEAVGELGRRAARAGGSGESPDAARAEIASFRGAGGDVLVVDGPQLLRPALRGSWNASIWLESGPVLAGEALESERAYVRDGDPRGAASAVLNVADPDRPLRVFSDSC